MDSTLVAAIKVSVESVAKWIISQYSIQNSKLRSIKDETANNKMFIAMNGPKTGEAEASFKKLSTSRVVLVNGTLAYKTNLGLLESLWINKLRKIVSLKYMTRPRQSVPNSLSKVWKFSCTVQDNKDKFQSKLGKINLKVPQNT